jgi:hypothetical protein
MTEDEQRDPEEDERLLRRLLLVSAVCLEVGWDLRQWLDVLRGRGTLEQLEEIIKYARALDRGGYFADLEDAWQRGREGAEGAS